MMVVPDSKFELELQAKGIFGSSIGDQSDIPTTVPSNQGGQEHSTAEKELMLYLFRQLITE